MTKRQLTAPAGGGVVLVVMAAPVLGAMVWLRFYPRFMQGLCQGASGGQKENSVMMRAFERLGAGP